MKKALSTLALAAALVALLPGCSTNVQGDDASPVFLAGEFQELPLQKNVNSGTPLQFNTTILRNRLKTTGVTSLQFLDVQVDTYRVRWTRLDGGKTASESQDFGGNVLVPPNGSANLRNYPYMSADALLRPPLDQLFPFNGGIDRETGKTEIDTAFDLTFFGHTVSGFRVQSQTASGILIFRYGGAAAAGARAGK